MSCPACGHDNRAQARFCDSCGAALAFPVPAETTRQPYTPRHLAEKILQSKAAVEGERKQVTVLFADVKGSMELQENLDPEEWHGIMDRFFQVLSDGIHRFEGTVNQYTGDGIMALFGAPIAHEDHAQRACWAALHLGGELRRYAEELKRSHGLAFAVRMGLNSGEVVVGRIGDDLRMDYTAIGHTVGLAQRMEQLAEPGRIYLTEHTAAHVGGLFALRDLGEFAIKGSRAPLRAHELEGVGPLRTRLDRSRARGFSRFVGRGTEMAALEAALERAIAGEGGAVGIVAEAGVGKSRLCAELVERCAARGLEVHEAHAVAHGHGTPLLVILELLRGVFGIAPRDSERTAREKIAGHVVLLDRGLEEALPLFFELLGVPDPERPAPRADPDAVQRRLFAALRRLLQARSRREPAVFLIEDLHWIDPASEAFVAELVETAAGTRTLVVLNFRPEYRAAWMEATHYRQVVLPPLGPAATDELLDDLLGGAGELAGLRALIAERTGGNPFFVEEIVQDLAEQGAIVGPRGARRLAAPIEVLAVPATVQALLAARIDRLAERDRRVLQTAAVIGRELAGPLLVAALEDEVGGEELGASLHALLEAELLVAVELWPEARYAFKHALTQEVANRSQLTERRAQVHARVARALEQDDPARADEHAALLGYHWEQAGDLLRAAQWETRAAAWVAAYALAERMRHWQRARAFADAAPDGEEAAALRLRARIELINFGFLVGQADEEGKVLLREGMELARRQGDRRLPIQLMIGSALARHFAGEIEASLAMAREVARQADADGDLQLHVHAATALARALLSAGRLSETVGVVDQIDSLPSVGGPIGGIRWEILASWFRAQALVHLGRLVDAGQEMAALRAAAQREGVDDQFEGHHLGSAFWACHVGLTEQALEHARRGVEVADAVGGAFHHASTRSVLGRALVDAGRFAEAVLVLRSAAEILEQRHTGLFMAGGTLAQLARAELGAGDLERARQAAEDAVAASRRYATPINEIEALHARAHVRLAAGDTPADVESDLRAAAALVVATEAAVYLPLLCEDRAALARHLGDDATAERELAEAQRLYTEMGASGHAGRIRAATQERT